MAGPLIGILNQAGGAMFGTQVGQALGGLADEVLTASDIGLPLGPAGKAALLPTNVARLRRGPRRERRGRPALPRAARGRPPAAVRPRAVAARPPARRRRGLRPRHHASTCRRSRSRCAASTRSNPAALQEALEGGLFEPQKTPAQQAALARLETTLALVEGWVDEVVGQATEDRMPSRGQAAGGGTPPPRRGRTGRVDLRRARRARAAARAGSATPPRCGARCAPARATRAATRSGRTPTCSPTAADLDDPLGFREELAEPRGAHRRRVRRRARRPARRRAGETGESAEARRRARPARDGRQAPSDDGPSTRPARRRAGGAARLGGAGRRAGAAAWRRTSRTWSAHPDGLRRSCFPDHLTAGALIVLAADRTHVLLTLHAKAQALVPHGRPLRARRTPRSPAPRSARPARSPA